MSSQCTFSFHHRWKEAERIAKRVAGVINDVDNSVTFRDGAWRLGNSNDWYIDINMESRTATLYYRYGKEEFMDHFAHVLNWIFS